MSGPDTLPDALLDPDQIPGLFVAAEGSLRGTKVDLFHPPEVPWEMLELANLPRGTTVADFGCGKAEAVTLLRSRELRTRSAEVSKHGQTRIGTPIPYKGLRVYGIDIAQPGLPQNPDMTAISWELPFPDNTFEVGINWWGGVTYPLWKVTDVYPEGTFSTPQEFEIAKANLQKRYVITFLQELREAFRVVSKELRIHPWSGIPFFDLSGTIAMESMGHVSLLAVDFRKMFQSMGATYKLGPVHNAGLYRRQMKYQIISLVKPAAINFEPIDELIKSVQQTDKPIIISESEIKKTSPDLFQALIDVRNLQGDIHGEQRDLDELQQKIRAGDYDRIDYNDYNLRRAAEQIGVDLFELSQESKPRAAELIAKIYQDELERLTPYLEEAKQIYQALFEKNASGLVIN